MDLFILRHGEAGKRQPSSKDSDRSLTVTGKKEVEDIARFLKDLEVKFDYVITSPLTRAQQTAAALCKVMSIKKNKIEGWDELKPEGSKPSFYTRLSQLKRESSVLLVGHEPYLSSMISEIVSDSKAARINLKKAGLAKIHIISLVPDVKGELAWLLTPKVMKATK
jgi:phosphohistidine phosphatase